MLPAPADNPYALVFDTDGVLIDNTPVQARAFQLLFRDLGLRTNARKLLARLNGLPAPNILQTVFKHPVAKKQLQEYAAQREFLYRTLHWKDRQEAAGLTDFLVAARAAGFKRGVGTGSPPKPSATSSTTSTGAAISTWWWATTMYPRASPTPTRSP